MVLVVSLSGAELDDLRERAGHGDREALNELGNTYAQGRGVPQDFGEALKYYRDAADRGLAEAWFNLGIAHELGRGVPAAPAAAFEHYLKAAERGSAPAKFNVGNMYANGTGVQQDLVEAVAWFRRAAGSSIPEAQFNLGLAYELGRGVRKDEVLAQRWYRMAARHDNAQAQYNLALMIEQGRGTESDPKGAMAMYRVAAARGFGPAQNNLGIMLAEGRGGTTDLVEAFVWLTLARGNGVVSDVYTLIEKQLSPSARAEADRVLAVMRAPADLLARTNGEGGLPAPLAAHRFVISPVDRHPAGEADAVELKLRLIDLSSALEKLRTEKLELATDHQALEQQLREVDERRRLAEATARDVVRAMPDPPSLRLMMTQTNLDDLGRADPRIAELLEENRRLQAMELAAVTRPAPQPQINAVRGADLSASAIETLQRRVDVLRSTVDKLAAESRWHGRVREELVRLQAENAGLRGGRRAVRK